MMTRYRICIASPRESLLLSNFSTCRVLDGGLVGFDFPETVVKYSQNAFSDGVTVTERCISPRILKLHFEVTDKGAYPEFRDKTARIMDPHGDVVITTFLYGRKRVINAIPYGAPEFILENFHDTPSVRLSFICEEPFFKDARTLEIPLPTHTPTLSFPLNLMKGAGTVCSFRSATFTHSVTNPGDVKCGFTATLTAERGSITQPFISLGTKRLQLLETVGEGSTVVFDTRNGSLGVSVDGVKKYSFDRTCEFFGLEAGENLLTVASVGDAKNLKASISLTPLYMGA